MKVTSILEYMTADGLSLSIADDGDIEIDGDQNTIEGWLETIRENKAAILAELKGASVQQPFNERSDSRKYSVVVTDASTDPVLVEVTIHGLASFTMEIPHDHYDGVALLQVIEQHSAEAASNLIGDTQPSTIAKEGSQEHPGGPARRAA
jgi:hypothetical protein